VNNPDPNGPDLPDLTEASVIAVINRAQALDGSRYGQGTHTIAVDFVTLPGGIVVPVPYDSKIGGRMLMEFTVGPSRIRTLGVRFDITRQMQGNAYIIANDGQGTLTSLAAFTRRFPWLAGNDNEL